MNTNGGCLMAVFAAAAVGLYSIASQVDRLVVLALAEHGRYIGPVGAFVAGAILAVVGGWLIAEDAGGRNGD